MPKEFPLFLIDKNKMAVVVEKLVSAGLTDHIITVNMFGGPTHVAFLNTEGTFFRATIDYINDNTHCTLYFDDKAICESSINSLTLYRNINYTIKWPFDELPATLLKPTKTLEQEKKLEEIKPDIFLSIGNKKPPDIDMSHLHYLGISESALEYQKKEKLFFLKLHKKEGFSYEKKYFFPGRHLIEYTLKYHGKPFARVINYFMDNESQLQTDPLQIAFARGNVDNIKEVPYYLSDKKEGPDKKTVAGTIDSCLDLIHSNQVKKFELAYANHRKKIAEELNYTLLGTEQINDFVRALSHNSTIEDITLYGNISKDGFLKIVKGVKHIKALQELSFYNMHIDITIMDMPEIYEAIADVPLETSNFRTNDKHHPNFDELTKAYQILLDKIDVAKKTKFPPAETVKIVSTPVSPPLKKIHYGHRPNASLFRPKTATAETKKAPVVPSAGDMKGILAYLQQAKKMSVPPDADIVLKLLQDDQFDFKDRAYCAIIKALHELDLLKVPAIFKIIAEHPENNSCSAISGYSKEVPSKIYPFWSIVSTKQSFQMIQKERWKKSFVEYVQSVHWCNQDEKNFAMSLVK